MFAAGYNNMDECQSGGQSVFYDRGVGLPGAELQRRTYDIRQPHGSPPNIYKS